ncbi:hypothetical protein GCM10011492_34150 [Flexivirga endophytica]|uniref:non-specific serine/threonine protein kinase n=1 Tax=Flexivirga endophytica TaxID=1849103 RepID=A0A916TCV3_9MICO|nr:protein kinase [Flexivirga endophytica]GGB40516.1 hypothetical protein GCM10011492_34150 [Flexivirga endophytica]GHB48334.1 hypothetical protein GCM10008112_16540 [Flexivirga endophytica]
MALDEPGRLPRQFGPYELLASIGQGGMGEVYRARDTRKDRIVAIKLLLRALSNDQQFRARFRREADIAARLNDPHVVPIHDYGEVDGTLYIEMPLIEGTDLASILRRQRLEPAEAVRVTGEIASALDAAHAQGLLHRDVKPGNILLTAKGFAYLTDFGIATQTDQTRLTGTGGAVGSMGYMAPERFEDGEPTRAVDEYALACVLFEALTGRQPYPSTSTGAVIKAHLFDEIPSPSSTGLTPPMDAVIRRGLAKDPAARFASAGEFADAAGQALRGRLDPETERIAGRGVTGVDPDRTHLAQHNQDTRTAAPAAGMASQGRAGGGTAGPWDSPAITPAGGPGGRRTKKPLVLAAMGVAVLLLAGAAGVFALKNNGDDDGGAAAAGSTTPSTTDVAKRSTASPPAADAASGPSSPTDEATSDAGSESGSPADRAPDTVTQYLSDLEPSSSEKPDSVDSEATLAGRPYQHLQAFSYCYSDGGARVSWALAGKWEKFSGWVGPTDDSRDREAGGELKIYLDNKLLWQSGSMKVGDAPKKFAIPVHGGHNLVVATTDGGDKCTDLAYLGMGDGALTGKNGVAPAPTAS